MIQSTPVSAISGRSDSLAWALTEEFKLQHVDGITRCVMICTRDGFTDVIIDSNAVSNAFALTDHKRFSGVLTPVLRWQPGIAIEPYFSEDQTGLWTVDIYLYDAVHIESVYFGRFMMEIGFVNIPTGLVVFSNSSPSNGVIISSDGLSWNYATIGFSDLVKHVAYSKSLGLYVALFASYDVLISTDRETWIRYTISGVGQTWQNIVWSPELGLFCTLSNHALSATSPDGINWTTHSMVSPLPDDGVRFFALCWSPELSLFVGSGEGWLITSPNGANWTTRIPGSMTPYLEDICWSKELSLFVGVSQSATHVATSVDGITWLNRSAPYTSLCVAWSKELGLFVAPCSPTANVQTSPDGVNWTGHAITYSTGFDIVWSRRLKLFIAVGGNPSLMTSTNGVDWSYTAIPNESWQCIGINE